jgi:hypothetical protein
MRPRSQPGSRLRLRSERDLATVGRGRSPTVVGPTVVGPTVVGPAAVGPAAGISPGRSAAGLAAGISRVRPREPAEGCGGHQARCRAGGS